MLFLSPSRSSVVEMSCVCVRARREREKKSCTVFMLLALPMKMRARPKQQQQHFHDRGRKIAMMERERGREEREREKERERERECSLSHPPLRTLLSSPKLMQRKKKKLRAHTMDCGEPSSLVNEAGNSASVAAAARARFH